MRILQSLSTLLLAASTAYAASSWEFDDATVSIKSRKGAGLTEKFTQKATLSKALPLDTTDTIRVVLKTKEDGNPKKPHQAFVIIKEEDTGLEAPFAFAVKESGKAVVEIPRKELPVQHLISKKPLHASIVIGSFGSSEGLVRPVFDIDLLDNPTATPPQYEKPLRYGKLPEIHHIFKDPDRVPPKIVSIFFTLAVLAPLPALFIGWAILGANLTHLKSAFAAAPISHAIFFGSIVAMEASFFMYHRSWNLFQLLPVAGVIGVINFLSGTKALGEVQSRRLAGER